MALAFKCDICGKMFELGEEEAFEPPMIVRRRISNRSEHGTHRNLDVCDFCADKIENTIMEERAKARK